MGKTELKMGAGIILIAFDGNVSKILGLIGDSYHREKHNAIYDLPKGTEDEGELALDCAIRETYEETGISIPVSKLIAGPYVTSFLEMWLAEIPMNHRIIIEKNPISGKLEHEGYAWLTQEEALISVYPYLVPFVKWAFQNV